jgi:hypothetical protein
MWVDSNKIDDRKIGWCSMDWIDLAPDGDRWRVLVDIKYSIKCWEVLQYMHKWWPLEKGSVPWSYLVSE